ncbi:hypothetical protein IMZ08_16180 [Bacillus luteolus]|uniref:Uncharacterized protein n=1 Tax=Litchfieldia luteola TaxID=682179 RepID=A0ABR9QM61_9BACI|nr:hypothetical protein [Cytobacillus luteolus]MBE4909591.1 hypothetical protein [Cytobacillus luteolus]MBP1940992.1 hypothetical protein [Cytobacillus luteolus]
MLYTGVLVLYAVAIGFIGFGLFLILIRSDKEKTIKTLGAGVTMFILAMIIIEFRPAAKGDILITADKIELTDSNGKSSCNVTDEYLGVTYKYQEENEEEVRSFCSQFQLGQNYTITYRYDEGQYSILKVK